MGLSASALVALVLIWNEAPIVVDAPSDDRVAWSGRTERPKGQSPDAIVPGDRTHAGPAAEPARPANSSDVDVRDDGTGRGRPLRTPAPPVARRASRTDGLHDGQHDVTLAREVHDDLARAVVAPADRDRVARRRRRGRPRPVG